MKDHSKTKPIKSLKSFIGKTIKKINETSENVLELEFMDGTELMLEANIYLPGFIGIKKYVPAINAELSRYNV